MTRPLPLFLLFYACTFLSLRSQAQDCSSGRFANDVFAGFTKSPDISFGQNTVRNNFTNASTTQVLNMNVYEPLGDVATRRPLVILAFGGGFIQGDRTQMEPVAIALARKGYVAATIDYRLIVNDPLNLFVVGSSTNLLVDEIIKATADMKAAIRYFKRDAATANAFRIDTTKIIIGGASAGAIAALQAAYMDNTTEITSPALALAYTNNGGFEGNTDLPAPNGLLGTYSASGVAGVLNIAGGVLDTTIIDSNDPPLFSAQGDADEVVPYTYGQLNFQGTSVPLALYGAGTITTRATNVGLENDLLTIAGGNHESPGDPLNLFTVTSSAASFMQSVVCGATLPVKLSQFTVRANRCAAELTWQTALESNNSHYEVELSADGHRFTTVATVASKNAANGAAYAYKINGTSKQGWFRLKMVDRDGSFAYSPIQRFVPQCNLTVQVYPNPAQSRATVNGLEAGMLVDVLTTDGKRVWSGKATDTMVDIPVGHFSKGLLLVQVRDAAGAVISNTKLMKN